MERSASMKSGNLDTNPGTLKKGFVSASIGVEDFAHTSALTDVAEPETPPVEAKPKFRFGRMFPELTPFQPPDEGLIDLGNIMFSSQDVSENLRVPAGYTFLGQFIAHDISFDVNLDILPTPINADEVENVRSPFLDLESLYGADPDLYQKDGVHLRVGDTEPVRSIEDDANRVYQNDLPRKDKKAIVSDFRSDENLALAQTYVAFLKFHNRVVDLLLSQESGPPSPAIFEEARKKVIQHYQWMVLHDFLPKIIEEGALKGAQDALKNGSLRFKVKDGETLFMPIEFSHAAFRIGHSMLAESYEWNRVFQSPGYQKAGRAKFIHLLLFTGSGGLQRNPTLPSNWIIDWTRFFDFTGFNGIANNPNFNYAKKFGTSLTPALEILKNFLTKITRPEFKSLPILDLIRGSRLKLPSGQDVAKALGLEPIRPSEMVKYPHQPTFKKFKFDEQTPLWYYVMREAELFHDGERLGPVGSQIIAETFVQLIHSSPHSILQRSGWKPDLGQRERNEFGMADLLVFSNVVNPLGA
jgi:hypothetical protein